MDEATDTERMRQAIAAAARVRATTTPNPWVGCVIVGTDGDVYEGATQPPGGPHAEIEALSAAGAAAAGATAYVTLEPCPHTGRTGPCAQALISAGIARVVVAIEDPDRNVAGEGLAALRAAGVETELGVCAEEAAAQLRPYLKHRSTGRPWVVLKLAASLDGRTAAPDGSSRWITGEAARADAHQLRAESDAVLVGAGTVRADDPELTVRHVPVDDDRQPLRVVLGQAPDGAKVHPCLEVAGDLDGILDDLGKRDVVQVLVEGGPTVAAGFHRAGLVDQYVVYLAPALFGGDDAKGLFAGSGAPTIDDVWRGRITAVRQLGDDLRIDLERAAG